MFRSNPTPIQGAVFLQDHYDLLLEKVNGDTTMLPTAEDFLEGIYGCGDFGCVWPVGDKTQVLKLSMDDGSGSIIKGLIKHPLPGLPRYYKVVTIKQPLARFLWKAPDWDDDQTLAIWRENVHNVGQMPPKLYEACYEYATAISKFVTAIKAFAKGKLPATQVTKRLKELGQAIHFIALAPAGGQLYDGIIKCLIEHQVLLSDLHRRNTGQNTQGHWIVFDPIFYPMEGALADELLKHA